MTGYPIQCRKLLRRRFSKRLFLRPGVSLFEMRTLAYLCGIVIPVFMQLFRIVAALYDNNTTERRIETLRFHCRIEYTLDFVV